MPQINTVTINDGASTPVAHTFVPLGRDKATGVFFWEQSTPVPGSKIAAKRLGYKQERILNPKKQLTGSSTVSYSVWVPTAATTTNNSSGLPTPPTLDYREVARISFELAERSTKQERKDTRVLAMNLLAHAMAIANVDDLEPAYS